MHGYAGNGLNAPITIPLVDDADLNPPTAAALNVGPQALADRTANALVRLGNLVPSNWGPVVPTGAPTNQAIFGQWDPANLRFLVMIKDPLPSPPIYFMWGWTGGEEQNFDDPGRGAQFFTGAPGSFSPQDVCQAGPAAGNFYFAAGIDVASHTFSVYRLDSSAGTPTWSQMLAATNDYESVRLCQFNGKIIAAVGSPNTSRSELWTSSDYGSSWSGHSPSPNPVAVWIIRANASTVLAIPLGAQPAPFITYSSDGTTWGTSDLSALIGTNDLITGLTFGGDALGAAWFMSVALNGGANGFSIFRSSDGIIWTLLSTKNVGFFLVDLAWIFTSLAGGILVGVTNFTTQSVVVYSLDGGATWQVAGTRFLSRPPNLVASPVQVMALNGLGVRTTMATGPLAVF